MSFVRIYFIRNSQFLPLDSQIQFYRRFTFSKLFSTIGNNSEENENIVKDSEKYFFNDEQTKWTIIFIGIAALIGLVLIQACCMIWRDRKDKEKKPQNVKINSNVNEIQIIKLRYF